MAEESNYATALDKRDTVALAVNVHLIWGPSADGHRYFYKNAAAPRETDELKVAAKTVKAGATRPLLRTL